MYDQMTKKEADKIQSDRESLTLEYNTWYWITDPREGDVWHPVYVSDNFTYILEGKARDVLELKYLTTIKAVMPT